MKQSVQGTTSANVVYVFGVIGAGFYFISHATGALAVVIGFFKAFVWPVFLVYEAFKHFGM